MQQSKVHQTMMAHPELLGLMVVFGPGLGLALLLLASLCRAGVGLLSRGQI